MNLHNKGLSKTMMMIFAIYLVVTAVIFLSMHKKNSDIVSGNDFRQMVDLVDLALGIEAVKSGNGEFEITYDAGKEIDYSIDEEKVTVNYGNPLSYRHSGIDNIKFENEGGSIILVKK